MVVMVSALQTNSDTLKRVLGEVDEWVERCGLTGQDELNAIYGKEQDIRFRITEVRRLNFYFV